MTSIHAFFAWCDGTPIALAIRDSLWLFPAIMVVHLLALAALGGTMLVVDLRLLGLGLRGRSANQLWRDLQGWTLVALGTMLASGVLLFLSEALRCYDNPPFWLKMTALAAALLFTFTARRKVVLPASQEVGWRERVTGITSIGLWFGVALMGRAIGFW